jgi:ankyrin repeat protein
MSESIHLWDASTFDDDVEKLLEEGAGLEVEDHMGTTLLEVAIHEGSTTELDLLNQGRRQRALEWVELLIEKGADVNAKKENGCTPLMFAVSGSMTPEIVSLLLEEGAEIEAKDNNLMTPLMYANAFADYPYPRAEIIKLLKAAGAKE